MRPLRAALLAVLALAAVPAAAPAATIDIEVTPQAKLDNVSPITIKVSGLLDADAYSQQVRAFLVPGEFGACPATVDELDDVPGGHFIFPIELQGINPEGGQPFEQTIQLKPQKTRGSTIRWATAGYKFRGCAYVASVGFDAGTQETVSQTHARDVTELFPFGVSDLHGTVGLVNVSTGRELMVGAVSLMDHVIDLPKAGTVQGRATLTVSAATQRALGLSSPVLGSSGIVKVRSFSRAFLIKGSPAIRRALAPMSSVPAVLKITLSVKPDEDAVVGEPATDTYTEKVTLTKKGRYVGSIGTNVEEQ